MKKSILISLLSLGFVLSSCVGGGGYSQDNFNPQPAQSNATNFFTAYAPAGNPSQNTVIQVQYSDSSKTTATGLYLFNLLSYTPNTPTSQAIIGFSLVGSGAGANNYIINSLGSNPVPSGYLQLKGNNIIMSLDFDQTPGVLGETSSIMLGSTKQQLAQNGSYIGFCFNLPNLLSTGNTNYGNDICQYTLNGDGTLTILDLAFNATTSQQNLCSNGSWSQSISNPYFYNLNCTGYNGANIAISTTFESYNNQFVMNQLIPSSISGNQGTAYVSTLFPSGSLDQFESRVQTLQQINLSAAGSVDQFQSIITNAQMTSENCALFGGSVGVCALIGYPTGQNIPNGVKQIQTPTYVSTMPAIMGSNQIGLFVDNNMYSYYFN